MYVCRCLKVSVNHDQPVRVVVFFHKTKCVNMVLTILNLEGQQNCMIGSKVTTILSTLSTKNQIQTKACGVSIQRQQTVILRCTVRFYFGRAYLKFDPKNTLRSRVNFIGFKALKVLFFNLTSGTLTQNEIRVCSAIFQYIASG